MYFFFRIRLSVVELLIFFSSCSLQQVMFIGGPISGRPWNGSWRLITFALCGRVDVKTFPRSVCHFGSDYDYIGDSGYLCDWIVSTMACMYEDWVLILYLVLKKSIFVNSVYVKKITHFSFWLVTAETWESLRFTFHVEIFSVWKSRRWVQKLRRSS